MLSLILTFLYTGYQHQDFLRELLGFRERISVMEEYTDLQFDPVLYLAADEEEMDSISEDVVCGEPHLQLPDPIPILIPATLKNYMFAHFIIGYMFSTINQWPCLK
ncbi:unnamed protein product [Rhizopus stolonifer]